ncbi:putative leucine-rich repeat-containing protein DDB_G0290503 isoform X2 [Drosophila miranda]|uniref:putative leucine-rich repeat-containing protein DDB_G0290503 isoform X2 n=1 Tax=Drosophila miranda TaxID=7229 RepID=UPI00143F9544|nr:putative leucine-rich repeat-containing protein DDB_G0290503 isoform X2 [Drosophila miranda]
MIGRISICRTPLHYLGMLRPTLRSTQQSPLAAQRLKHDTGDSGEEPSAKGRTRLRQVKLIEERRGSGKRENPIRDGATTSGLRTKSVGLESEQANNEPMGEAKDEPMSEAKDEVFNEAKEVALMSASKDEPMSEAKNEPMSQAKNEPMSEAKNEPMSQAKNEPMSEAKDEPISEAKNEVFSEAKGVALMSATKDEPISEAKNEPFCEAKDEAFTGAQHEPMSEAKDSPRSDAQDEAFTTEIPQERRQESPFESRPELPMERQPALPAKTSPGEVNPKNPYHIVTCEQEQDTGPSNAEVPEGKVKVSGTIIFKDSSNFETKSLKILANVPTLKGESMNVWSQSCAPEKANSGDAKNVNDTKDEEAQIILEFDTDTSTTKGNMDLKVNATKTEEIVNSDTQNKIDEKQATIEDLYSTTPKGYEIGCVVDLSDVVQSSRDEQNVEAIVPEIENVDDKIQISSTAATTNRLPRTIPRKTDDSPAKAVEAVNEEQAVEAIVPGTGNLDDKIQISSTAVEEVQAVEKVETIENPEEIAIKSPTNRLPRTIVRKKDDSPIQTPTNRLPVQWVNEDGSPAKAVVPETENVDDKIQISSTAVKEEQAAEAVKKEEAIVPESPEEIVIKSATNRLPRMVVRKKDASPAKAVEAVNEEQAVESSEEVEIVSENTEAFKSPTNTLPLRIVRDANDLPVEPIFKQLIPSSELKTNRDAPLEKSYSWKHKSKENPEFIQTKTAFKSDMEEELVAQTSMDLSPEKSLKKVEVETSEAKEFKSEMNELQSETKELQSEMNELQSETKELQTEINELQSETKELQSEMNELQSETKELQPAMNERQSEATEEKSESTEAQNPPKSAAEIISMMEQKHKDKKSMSLAKRSHDYPSKSTSQIVATFGLRPEPGQGFRAKGQLNRTELDRQADEYFAYISEPVTSQRTTKMEPEPSELEKKMEPENSELAKSIEAETSELDRKVERVETPEESNRKAEDYFAKIHDPETSELEPKIAEFMKKKDLEQSQLELKMEPETSKLSIKVGKVETPEESNRKIHDPEISELEPEIAEFMKKIDLEQSQLEMKMEPETSELDRKVEKVETPEESNRKAEEYFSKINKHTTPELEAEISKCMETSKLPKKILPDFSKLYKKFQKVETPEESERKAEEYFAKISAPETSELAKKMEQEKSELANKMEPEKSELTKKKAAETSQLGRKVEKVETPEESNRKAEEYFAKINDQETWMLDRQVEEPRRTTFEEMFVNSKSSQYFNKMKPKQETSRLKRNETSKKVKKSSHLDTKLDQATKDMALHQKAEDYFDIINEAELSQLEGKMEPESSQLDKKMKPKTPQEEESRSFEELTTKFVVTHGGEKEEADEKSMKRNRDDAIADKQGDDTNEESPSDRPLFVPPDDKDRLKEKSELSEGDLYKKQSEDPVSDDAAEFNSNSEPEKRPAPEKKRKRKLADGELDVKLLVPDEAKETASGTSSAIDAPPKQNFVQYIVEKIFRKKKPPPKGRTMSTCCQSRDLSTSCALLCPDNNDIFDDPFSPEEGKTINPNDKDFISPDLERQGLGARAIRTDREENRKHGQPQAMKIDNPVGVWSTRKPKTPLNHQPGMNMSTMFFSSDSDSTKIRGGSKQCKNREKTMREKLMEKKESKDNKIEIMGGSEQCAEKLEKLKDGSKDDDCKSSFSSFFQITKMFWSPTPTGSEPTKKDK